MTAKEALEGTYLDNDLLTDIYTEIDLARGTGKTQLVYERFVSDRVKGILIERGFELPHSMTCQALNHTKIDWSKGRSSKDECIEVEDSLYNQYCSDIPNFEYEPISKCEKELDANDSYEPECFAPVMNTIEESEYYNKVNDVIKKYSEIKMDIVREPYHQHGSVLAYLVRSNTTGVISDSFFSEDNAIAHKKGMGDSYYILEISIKK